MRTTRKPSAKRRESNQWRLIPDADWEKTDGELAELYNCAAHVVRANRKIYAPHTTQGWGKRSLATRKRMLQTTRTLIGLRLTDEQHERLSRMAKKLGESRTTVIENALRLRFDRMVAAGLIDPYDDGKPS